MLKVIKFIKFNHKMQILKFSNIRSGNTLKLSKLIGCKMNKNNFLLANSIFIGFTV